MKTLFFNFQILSLKVVKCRLSDAALFEMKAQALMNVHEWVPSIQCSEACIRLQPGWWVGHQTLGRAQIGLGEVGLAVKSFERAVHLNPADEELRRDDLDWAVSLLRDKQKLDDGETSQTSLGEASQSRLTKLRT